MPQPIFDQVKIVMNSSSTEAAALLSLLIRAMVADREAVSVVPVGQGRKVVFRVLVSGADKGKLIGLQGRNARALRQILFSIGREQNSDFLLDLDSADIPVPDRNPERIHVFSAR